MPTIDLSRVTAAQIMTRDIVTAQDDWDIITLAEFLLANGISGAPVLDGDGRPCGVVSVTDIARFTVEGDPADEHRYAHHYYTDRLMFEEYEIDEGIDVREDDEARVADIMTPSLFTIEESASLEEVSRTMSDNHIHRIFVSQDGQITGLISALDVLAAFAGKPLK
ncbi:Conserved hypothetical protein [gamma proteobacterium HdN1]|nr:Conserved hypothetical protein [gamma proteobacterium HdN1]